MAKRAIGVLITGTSKPKEKSNPIGVAIFAIIGVLWFYYYGEFAAWFSEATGGPAGYVENQNR